MSVNKIRSPENQIAFFDPKWETAEGYHDKFERLRDLHEAAGRPFSVWAVSAGASLATRLCVEVDDDTAAHLVCGKIRGSASVGAEHQQRAPAFLESVEYSEMLAGLLNDATRCYVPKNNADRVIGSQDMIVPQARVIDLPALRHKYAITYAAVRFLPGI